MYFQHSDSEKISVTAIAMKVIGSLSTKVGTYYAPAVVSAAANAAYLIVNRSFLVDNQIPLLMFSFGSTLSTAFFPVSFSLYTFLPEISRCRGSRSVSWVPFSCWFLFLPH